MSYHTKLTTLVLMFNSTELFCVIDDFFLKFESTYWEFLKQNRGSLRIRTAQLTISEICFIAIWYKCSHFNNFKAFFSWLKEDKSHLFKYLPCYQRKATSNGCLTSTFNFGYLWEDYPAIQAPKTSIPATL